MKPFATFRFNNFGASRKPRSTRGISNKVTRVCSKRAAEPSLRNSRENSLTASGGSARGSRVNKVGKHWLTKPAVIIRSDGREICNPGTPEGCADYKWRIVCMWVRQEGMCCNCGEPLALKMATFEHEALRGKDRDDRIALFDETGRFLRSINGVSHLLCNSRRGSRRTEIWHGENFVIEKESA